MFIVIFRKVEQVFIMGKVGEDDIINIYNLEYITLLVLHTINFKGSEFIGNP
jgi:hypothetical protein